MRGSGAIRCAALALLGGVVSCLPIDTRPPPGSLFLAVVSDDEPSVTTADGWSISVDRLLLGIGGTRLLPVKSRCTNYTDDSYDRLLDARLSSPQKVNIIYGLGQCHFVFSIASPQPNALLGEGVTDGDKDLMGIGDHRQQDRPPEFWGIAVDFAATATRGSETKHVHWLLRQGTGYQNCGRKTETGASQPMQLESDENTTLHVGIRGVELFGDDESPTDAALRFDPFVYADTEFGDGDGDVTLEEIDRVDLNRLRGSGPYGASRARSVPSTLKDYVHLVLLFKIARFRENVVCVAPMRPTGPPRPD
jgi:hypothetical protein